MPESFKVLIKELQSLCLDIKVLTEDKQEIIIRELEDEDLAPESEFKEELTSSVANFAEAEEEAAADEFDFDAFDLGDLDDLGDE